MRARVLVLVRVRVCVLRGVANASARCPGLDFCGALLISDSLLSQRSSAFRFAGTGRGVSGAHVPDLYRVPICLAAVSQYLPTNIYGHMIIFKLRGPNAYRSL